MKFTQMPSDAFKNLQLNAGIILDSFTPSTETIGNIIGATSGGITFTAVPTYEDFGADIDNCPTNVKQLKKLTEWVATMTGTFKSVDTDLAKMLIGCADIDSADSTHIVPRRDVEADDFEDVWWVGDYSDVNSGTTAGFMAIHLMNSLSTGGFSIKSNNKGKGDFAFTFTAHYDLTEQTTVPFEIYIKVGA